MSAIEKLDLEIECSEADFRMMGWRIYGEEPFAGSTEEFPSIQSPGRIS